MCVTKFESFYFLKIYYCIRCIVSKVLSLTLEALHDLISNEFLAKFFLFIPVFQASQVAPSCLPVVYPLAHSIPFTSNAFSSCLIIPRLPSLKCSFPISLSTQMQNTRNIA